MKNLIICIALLFGSFIAIGQTSTDDETFTYRVTSITQCFIEDGEVFQGETTFPKDDRVIYIDNEEVSVIIYKRNIKITFDIKKFEFDEGNLVYTTKHRLSGDTVVIIVKRFKNGVYTFSFINFNDDDDCYIYRAEYFEESISIIYSNRGLSHCGSRFAIICGCHNVTTLK